jgi:hypothetical protein
MPEVHVIPPARVEPVHPFAGAPAKVAVPHNTLASDCISSVVPVASLHIANARELTDAWFQSEQAQQDRNRLARRISPDAIRTAAKTIEKCQPPILPRNADPSMNQAVKILNDLANTYEQAENKGEAAFIAGEAATKLSNQFALKSAEAFVDGATIRGVLDPSDHRSEKAALLTVSIAHYFLTVARLVENAFMSASPSLTDSIVNHGFRAASVKENYISNSDNALKRKAFEDIPEAVRPAYGTLASDRPNNGYS